MKTFIALICAAVLLQVAVASFNVSEAEFVSDGIAKADSSLVHDMEKEMEELQAHGVDVRNIHPDIIRDAFLFVVSVTK